MESPRRLGNVTAGHGQRQPITPEKLVRRYYRLFNERRLDEAGQLVDPLATFHYLPTRQRLMGRAGYRALAAAWVIAFEDAVVEIKSLETVNDHTIRLDFVGRGTHTGDLVLGENLIIPATGRNAELPFRETIEVRNGLITKVEFDFDVDELSRTLMDGRTP